MRRLEVVDSTMGNMLVNKRVMESRGELTEESGGKKLEHRMFAEHMYTVRKLIFRKKARILIVSF